MREMSSKVIMAKILRQRAIITSGASRLFGPRYDLDGYELSEDERVEIAIGVLDDLIRDLERAEEEQESKSSQLPPCLLNLRMNEVKTEPCSEEQLDELGL